MDATLAYGIRSGELHESESMSFSRWAILLCRWGGGLTWNSPTWENVIHSIISEPRVQLAYRAPQMPANETASARLSATGRLAVSPIFRGILVNKQAPPPPNKFIPDNSEEDNGINPISFKIPNAVNTVKLKIKISEKL